MQKIAEMVGRELRWTQPRAMRMEWELRSGEELVATLRFRSSWGSFATAESADGCWTFKRMGFWQTRATVRPCNSETEIATFRNSTWACGGSLELPDGRKYLATTNFWSTRYQIQTEQGDPLIRFQLGGLVRLSAQMVIETQATRIPELPWMALLGWYLAVMLHNDTAAAAVAAAGASGAS